MEVLKEGIYYVKKGHAQAPESTRVWHDCKEYTSRSIWSDEERIIEKREARVEMSNIGETQDTIKFKCPYCNFEFVFDKKLEIQS